MRLLGLAPYLQLYRMYYVIVWGNALRRSSAFLGMLSSLLHSGLSSASLPQSVSAEGSQTVGTMGASTVSTSGEVQRGMAAGSDRSAVYVVVTNIIRGSL